MKITINTEILKKHNISIGEFLILLIGYFDISFKTCIDRLKVAKIIMPNVFDKDSFILSNNTKNLVAEILMESDDRAINSTIDFEKLAVKLQSLYPPGIKSGTTYSWRGSTDEIAFKLRALVVKYGFMFTEEEAIRAVQDYVHSFGEYKHMHILKNFILRTNNDSSGNKDIESLFMTIIENSRTDENSN